jgi:hypothetical protein
MDPMSMTMAAQMIAAGGKFAGTVAQGSADRQKAAIEQAWAKQQSNEARAAGQAAAGDESRKAAFAQSRLTALSGASGSSASDPTVKTLAEGIEKERQINAGRAQAAGDQRAQGIDYQAALNKWSTDTSSRIKDAAAGVSLIGDIGGGMAKRYGMPGPRAGTGYGSSSGGWTTTVSYG